MNFLTIIAALVITNVASAADTIEVVKHLRKSSGTEILTITSFKRVVSDVRAEVVVGFDENQNVKVVAANESTTDDQAFSIRVYTPEADFSDPNKKDMYSDYILIASEGVYFNFLEKKDFEALKAAVMTAKPSCPVKITYVYADIDAEKSVRESMLPTGWFLEMATNQRLVKIRKIDYGCK